MTVWDWHRMHKVPIKGYCHNQSLKILSRRRVKSRFLIVSNSQFLLSNQLVHQWVLLTAHKARNSHYNFLNHHLIYCKILVNQKDKTPGNRPVQHNSSQGPIAQLQKKNKSQRWFGCWKGAWSWTKSLKMNFWRLFGLRKSMRPRSRQCLVNVPKILVVFLRKLLLMSFIIKLAKKENLTIKEWERRDAKVSSEFTI